MALEHLYHAARLRAGDRPRAPAGPRILVVDPNPRLRHALLEVLRRHDLTAAEAADAGGALCAIREWKPTVAVVELRLRNHRTGIDVLRSLQAIAPDLRVIIHAAPTDAAKGDQATAAGAFAFVTRTSDHGRLLDAVRAAHRANAAHRADKEQQAASS